MRIESAEAVCHVTSRGNARRSIFKDHEDRERGNLKKKGRIDYEPTGNL